MLRLVRKKPRAKAFALAVLMCAALSGCVEKDAYIPHEDTNAVSFSWWGKDQRNEYTLAAVDAFEKKTKIPVEVHFGEYEGFKKHMDMQFYSDTEADVMQLNYDWLYEYSPDGEGFYDLNELDDYIDLSVFSEKDLECATINGKLNALPTSFNAITFYYNKKMYESYGLDLPETWDDVIKAAEVMGPDGVYPLELSPKSAWLSAAAYYEQTTGNKLYSATQLRLTKDGYRTMLEFYLSLIEAGVTPGGDKFNRNDLENKKCAGLSVWISDAEYYCDPSLDKGLDIVVGDYLQTKNASLFGWYKKPTSLYAIKKDTKHPYEAARLMDFLENSKQMNTLQKLGKGIPVSKAALEILEAHDMLKGIQFDANEKMKGESRFEMMSPYIEDTDAVELFSDTAKKISEGRLTMDEALEQTYDQIKELIGS